MLLFPHQPPLDRFTKLFEQIELLSLVVARTDRDESHQKYVFHQQLLKSSLFSARIEGNTLTLPAVKNLERNPREKNKKEVSNTLKALEHVSKLSFEYTPELIKHIHKIVMKDLDSSTGTFRHESSAIYDQYGSIVYLTPSPEEMFTMLEELVLFCQQQPKLDWKEQLVLIARCHYYFEKIHPFIDGNGRTGRVLMHYQLNQVSLFKKIFLPIDQYFEQYRGEYYQYLEKNSRMTTGFITFFLEAVVWSLLLFLSDIQNIQKQQESSSAKSVFKPTFATLSPRRQELYHTINDHPFISLNAIARRFPTIPKRTLAYDLKKLAEQKFIVKQGTTRGVVYSSSTKE